LRELIGLSLIAGGGCGLGLSQGEFLFVAVFGPAWAVFNKLPEKSRCILFQRMLTIVYVAQDAEPLPSPSE
jgi:hypothetical protein